MGDKEKVKFDIQLPLLLLPIGNNNNSTTRKSIQIWFFVLPSDSTGCSNKAFPKKQLVYLWLYLHSLFVFLLLV